MSALRSMDPELGDSGMPCFSCQYLRAQLQSCLSAMAKHPEEPAGKVKAYYAYLIYLGKIGSVIPSRILGADSMHRQSYSHQNPGPGYRTCGNPAGDSISTPVWRAEALLSSMGLTWLGLSKLVYLVAMDCQTVRYGGSIGSMESVELCILKGNI